MAPTATPLDPGAWVENEENLLVSFPSWKPLKEVTQEDLNQKLWGLQPESELD